MSDERKRNGPWGGRSNRKQYWLLALLVLVLSIALSFLPGGGSAASSIFVWSMLYARRLHDIGRSGWWGVAAMAGFLLPLIVAIAVGGWTVLSQISGRTEPASEQEAFWDLVGVYGYLLLQLGFTVWLGVVKGDAGENRFGPAPGKRAAVAL